MKLLVKLLWLQVVTVDSPNAEIGEGARTKQVWDGPALTTNIPITKGGPNEDIAKKVIAEMTVQKCWRVAIYHGAMEEHLLEVMAKGEPGIKMARLI